MKEFGQQSYIDCIWNVKKNTRFLMFLFNSCLKKSDSKVKTLSKYIGYRLF